MSQVDSLDKLLFECTNTSVTGLNVDTVSKFTDAVNTEGDGPATAARLLGHKIQSPQEQESLNALCVADECVRKCGRRFQDEIGKFRFLNEIIKMISPKYFGDRTSQKVKDKCIELLYRWSVELRHEPKIGEAYEMLKRQGIIEDDPLVGESIGDVQPASEADSDAAAGGKEEKHSIFDDDDKSKLLAKLLRSRNPDDLQAANRLIKNMVKQDEEKQEKISQRYQLLETVKNNVKLLNEMLDCYQMAGGSSSSDYDIIKELFQNIEAERPKLFKMASETEDKDSEGISQILQVNDDVVQIAARYKQVITTQGAPSADAKAKSTTEPKSLLSDDLADLDLGPPASSTAPASSSGLLDDFAPPLPPRPGRNSAVITPSGTTTSGDSLFDLLSSAAPSYTSPVFSTSMATGSSASPMTQNTKTTASSNDLDDFFSLGDTATAVTQASQMKTSSSASEDIGLLSLDGGSMSAGLAAPLMPAARSDTLFDTTDEQNESLFDTKKSALEDLDFLGQDLLQKTKPTQQVFPSTTKAPAAPAAKPSLNQLKAGNTEKSLTPTTTTNASSTITASPSPSTVQVLPLTSVFVSLDSVKPGDKPPLSVVDKDGIKIILHFAQNKPREDVTVMVLSVMSTKTSPVKALVFQAAVPKSMKVKLQPPSGTELPAYNPILPPSAITQVMLLANPSKEKVKLKYKLTYNSGGTPVTEVGDVANFPL